MEYIKIKVMLVFMCVATALALVLAVCKWRKHIRHKRRRILLREVLTSSERNLKLESKLSCTSKLQADFSGKCNLGLSVRVICHQLYFLP